MKKISVNNCRVLSFLLFLFMAGATASAQIVKLNPPTTQITVQGNLHDNGTDANGSYDFETCLCQTSDCDPIPLACAENTGVSVIAGIYSYRVNFAAGFWDGGERFFRTAIRRDAGEDYVILTPFEFVTSNPYAIRSIVATEADDLSDNCVDCIGSDQIEGLEGNKVISPIPVLSVPAGSNSYIQNQNAAPQTGNFDITGTAGADTFDAKTQYNLSGERVLFANSAPALNRIGSQGNTFVGLNTGTNTTGGANSFFGAKAGFSNTTSINNSFFGFQSGEKNMGGDENSFFGSFSGAVNREGRQNSFFGAFAGGNNNTGNGNSFFGVSAGQDNSSSSNNSFFGFQSGFVSTGPNNSFFGKDSGKGNRTGQGNTFIGAETGTDNQDGNFNTYIGFQAGFDRPKNEEICIGAFSCRRDGVGLRGTTLGARAGGGGGTVGGLTELTGTSPNDNSSFGFEAGKMLTTGFQNSFYGSTAGAANTNGTNNSYFGFETGKNSNGFQNSFFGSKAGSVNDGGANNSFFGFEAGTKTSAQNNAFFGSRSGAENTTGTKNAFFGSFSGVANVGGNNNAFFGEQTGSQNLGGSFNSFYGTESGRMNIGGANNSFFGESAGERNNTGNNNTFLGQLSGDGTTSGSSNTFVGFESGRTNQMGGNNTTLGANANVSLANLGFATAIGAGATVGTSNTVVIGRGNGFDTVKIPGIVQVDFLSGSGATAVCRNALFQLSFCSSSLRYKTNVRPFGLGLDLLRQLNPITFDWKDGGTSDLGLGAEDVAEIEPLLVTYDKSGRVEGVKYDRLGVVLLNAVKEQQTQIEAQDDQIKQQQKQIELQKTLIDGLLKIVCSQNPNAEVCKGGENEK